MKNIINKFLVAGLICLLPQVQATASSHREAPLISYDPLADNTDLYVFRSPCDSNKIVIIANYIPFEHPAGGPNWYNFGQNIRYEIHIKNKTTTITDDITYRFTFTQVNQDTTTFFNIRLGKQNIKDVYTCQRSMDGGLTWTTIMTNGVVPPPNIGPRSIQSAVGLGAASYDALMMSAVATATTGEKLFAGPVDDPFFVDLGGAFDVGGFRAPGRDGLAKFNCHSIVLEIPISTLQKTGLTTASATSILDPNFVIGVWASASRQSITTLSTTGGAPVTAGTWVQVSRIGMPLTNEVVIPIGAKDRWNGANPYISDTAYETYFKNPELALYMDTSAFALAVPGLSKLRIQANSLGSFDFRNTHPGLFPVRGTPGTIGTAFDPITGYPAFLLPDNHSPRAVDLLPIFYTGVPNLNPYQLATGKTPGNPLTPGKPFINNFLPTFCDMIRLNMAVPVTSRTDPKFSSLGLVQAAVLGLTDPAYNTTTALQFIPNMDGFPNGRRLDDDVTTIELQAVSGVVLAAIGLWYDDYSGSGSPVTTDLTNVLGFNAGVTHNDTTFKACFPYLQDPWPGFTGAQYTGPASTQLPLEIASLPIAAPVYVMNAYPNPFTSQISFRYKMDVDGKVSIQVMDINGRTVNTINEGYKTTGDYTTQWNAGNVPAGNYVAVLSINGQQIQTIKLVKAN